MKALERVSLGLFESLWRLGDLEAFGRHESIQSVVIRRRVVMLLRGRNRLHNGFPGKVLNAKNKPHSHPHVFLFSTELKGASKLYEFL